MKKIVVNDTNVFIDLLNLGLLEHFFSLSWEIHTTDLVMHELLRDGQKAAVEAFNVLGKLTIAEFNQAELGEIIKLKNRNAKTNVSITDCSVWYYAKVNNYALLTGDRKLKISSAKDGVEVHGIIYVFDALVEETVISKEHAANKLKELRNNNPRLPQDEIEKRITEWEDVKDKKGEKPMKS